MKNPKQYSKSENNMGGDRFSKNFRGSIFAPDPLAGSDDPRYNILLMMKQQDSFNFELFKSYFVDHDQPNRTARIRFTHARGPGNGSGSVLVRIYDGSSPTAERVLDMTDLDDFVTTDPDGFREEVCDAAGLNRSGWETDPCTIIEDSADGEYGITFARAIWNSLVKNGFSVMSRLNTSSPVGTVPPHITKITSNYALEA